MAVDPVEKSSHQESRSNLKSQSSESYPQPSFPQAPSGKPSCLARASYIPNEVFEVTKDQQWMSVFSEVTGIASQVCEFTANSKAMEAVPFLSFAVAPIYMTHAFANAFQRLKMVAVAIRAHSVAMIIFNLGQAIDAVGNAIGNITKSLSGGFTLVGVGTLVSGIFFTLILPIILIVTGTIGGIMQGWSFGKNAKALYDFNQQAKQSDSEVKALLSVLDYIHGPSQPEDIENKKAQALFKLEKSNFKNAHFTSRDRQKAIQKNTVDTLLEKHDLQLVGAVKALIKSKDLDSVIQRQLQTIEEKKTLEPAIELLKRMESLLQAILTTEENGINQVDEIVEISDVVEKLFTNPSLAVIWKQEGVEELLTEIKKNKGELQALKNGILQDGQKVVTLMRSEIHRAILMSVISLLIASLVFTSGILPLVYHTKQVKLIASVMALSSSGLYIVSVIFNKKVSLEQFHRAHLFLHR